MGISIETLAVAKKYTDKSIASVGDDGVAVIPNNFIGKDKLTEDLNKDIDASTVHTENTAVSEEGAHNLRYFNNTLQYYNGSNWITLSISDLLI